MSAPVVEVLGIGDELIHGRLIDTNSAWIADRLEALGGDVARFTVVGDDPGRLDRAVAEAVQRCDVLICTGGLGPTEDDRTRHAIAAAAGADLAFDPESWSWIEAWFRERGRPLTDDNRRQALVPIGGRALHNRWGTAPGLAMQVGRCLVFALPGVPREMEEMLRAVIEPEFVTTFADRLRPAAHRTLRVLGPTEAALGARLERHMRPGGPFETGITAQMGLLSVRLVARAATAAAAEQAVAAAAEEVAADCGDDLVYVGDETLAERVVARLRSAGRTVTFAESCTGGLVAAHLTDVAGSSDVFHAGFVTYADAEKTARLGVPVDVLEAHGAVSEPVAAAMVAGALEAAGADLAVAITGIAGPGGGSDEKPVGTVWFGLARRASEGSAPRITTWHRRIAPVNRRFVRERAVFEVFAALLRELEDASETAKGA